MNNTRERQELKLNNTMQTMEGSQTTPSIITWKNRVKPSHTVVLMHIIKMAKQTNGFEIYKKGPESWLHATHRLQDAIKPHLWPYTLKMANDIINITPRSRNGLVPMKTFLQGLIRCNKLDNLHPFGCPVYILDTRLQQMKIYKWQQRSRVGVYLGQSGNHTRTVHLVLSIKTWLVSLKYHVQFWNNKAEGVLTKINMASRSKTCETST